MKTQRSTDYGFKKLIFTILAVIFFSFYSKAQISLTPDSLKDETIWTIGPRAGAISSWLSGLTERKFRLNFSGGVFVNYSIWRRFGISADILYSNKGVNYDAMADRKTLRRKIYLDYLEVPIMANFYLRDKEDDIRPKIFIGPSFNYLLGATEVPDAPNKISFIAPELAAVGGVGVNVRLKEKLWLNVDARYIHGFRNINHRKRLGPDPLRNRAVSLLVGLGFGI